MKELHTESVMELLQKTKELKETIKRQSKDHRLIQNLKLLMRDFNQESISMLEEVGNFSRQTLMTTLNRGQDHNQLNFQNTIGAQTL